MEVLQGEQGQVLVLHPLASPSSFRVSWVYECEILVVSEVSYHQSYAVLCLVLVHADQDH